MLAIADTPAPDAVLPAIQPAMQTVRELVLLGAWSPWVQVLVGALALGILGLTVYNYRGLLPRWRRVLLVALRAAIVVMLLAMFYQPAILEENTARGRNLVPVLVDLSESMGLPHGESTRLELAREFVRDHDALWDELREGNDLVFHGFGQELSELPNLVSDGDALAGLNSDARQTRVMEALAQLRARYRNQDLGAVVLLTDAIDTTAASRRARLDPAGEGLIRELDAPIVTFALPDDGHLKDISVAEIVANGFAFVMNATTLDAIVRVHGYSEGELVARLLENGREVSRQAIPLVTGQTEYTVTFDFVPRKLGKQVYGVSVEHMPDEIYGQNNSRQAIVKVIRDKVRILQIVGQPSWDERFLRNHLKEDPNIDLISFFIMVSQDNYRPVSSGETSLIPFPAQELFEEELGGFDLAIFQNFNYGPFKTREYLPAIAQFVRDGGAFLMIGGPKSFSAGGYYGTPITDVLPVEIPPRFGDERREDEASFRARLTDAGTHHPITRLMLDPATNQNVWENLEELQGVNLVTRARADAVVLAEHPTLKDDQGRAMPVISVREVDKGRSMAVTTDSIWAWSFPAGNEGQDSRHFDTFWSNSIRWLIKDPEMDLVRVRAVRERVSVGDEARATVEVFRPDYQPAADQAVEVTVRRRDEGSGAGEGEIVLRVDDGKTDADGSLDLAIRLEKPGIYEVEASAAVVAGRRAVGTDLFVGTEVDPELETVIGDGRLVKLLAQASGGSVQSLDTAEPKVEPHPPRVTRVMSRRHDELWNAPWVLAALALLFGAEWWLRRRYGFL
ncbi:MAG: glutamine amidotransferase [Myxococcota bacterium]